jgi:hypothetical protein
MVKFLLVIKICSALDGDCIPEQAVAYIILGMNVRNKHDRDTTTDVFNG